MIYGLRHLTFTTEEVVRLQCCGAGAASFFTLSLFIMSIVTPRPALRGDGAEYSFFYSS
jgi:hypothetical protein